MSADGQRTKRRRNIAENFNRLSRVHERYRQTTDGRMTTYSEREREFTFANNEYREREFEAKVCSGWFGFAFPSMLSISSLNLCGYYY